MISETKVFQIWSTAGIPCILSKYLGRHGVKSEVIARANFDPFGYLKFYEDCTEIVNGHASTFIYKALKRARDYDLIHVHGLDYLVPILKAMRKPVVLHYHGHEIRDRNRGLRKRYYQRLADKVLVSTDDLQRWCPDAEWLPNPVDTEHFSPQHVNKNDKYLTFKLPYLDWPMCMKYIHRMHLKDEDMIIMDRSVFPVLYSEMPDVLSMFEYYVDVKYTRNLIPSISTTALQALSVGCKVMNAYGCTIERFPEHHDASRVAAKLVKIYERVLS